MNKAESRAMRRLEIRIEELERHFRIANNAHTETFGDLFEARVAMRQAHDALVDAVMVLNTALKGDSEWQRKQIGLAAAKSPNLPES